MKSRQIVVAPRSGRDDVGEEILMFLERSLFHQKFTLDDFMMVFGGLRE
jgi:hypothetical protein